MHSRQPLKHQRVDRRTVAKANQSVRNAGYDVGTMYHWKEGEDVSAKIQYAFAKYFRCRECDAAGPWTIADYTRLLVPVMAAVVRSADTKRLGGYAAAGLGCSSAWRSRIWRS